MALVPKAEAEAGIDAALLEMEQRIRADERERCIEAIQAVPADEYDWWGGVLLTAIAAIRALPEPARGERPEGVRE